MATSPVPSNVSHCQLCLVAEHSCTLCGVPRRNQKIIANSRVRDEEQSKHHVPHQDVRLELGEL